mmetsp:Transcript_3714/g.11079  ORF Transcript_3714/g.11079 Transcript_3714/m.11079 type:complete len:157 (+) Transcript_3714:1105-1575(+)
MFCTQNACPQNAGMRVSAQLSGACLVTSGGPLSSVVYCTDIGFGVELRMDRSLQVYRGCTTKILRLTTTGPSKRQKESFATLIPEKQCFLQTGLRTQAIKKQKRKRLEHHKSLVQTRMILMKTRKRLQSREKVMFIVFSMCGFSYVHVPLLYKTGK